MFGLFKGKREETSMSAENIERMVDVYAAKLIAEMMPPMVQGFAEGFRRQLSEKGITDPATQQNLLAAAQKGFEKGAAETIREKARTAVLAGIGKR